MESYGTTVTEGEAHTYIEGYKTIRATLIADVAPWVPAYAPQTVKDSITFHKSNVNAFLFDGMQFPIINSRDNPSVRPILRRPSN